MKKPNLFILNHLPAFALLVIVYCSYARVSLAGGLLNNSDLLFQVFLGTLLFYGNVYGLFPWLGRRFGWRRKTSWLALLIEAVVLLVVILAISQCTNALEIRIRSVWGLAIQVTNLLAVLFPLMLCLLYSVQHYNLHRMKSERQRVLSDSAELENRLAALQQEWAHVHLPEHFLVNALALLRALSMAGSPRLGEAYDLLLDVLHYCLRARNKKTVSVKRELKQTKKYIKIADLRYGGLVKLAIITRGPLNRARIVPMAILTLVENIFAHGEFRNDKAELHVDYGYPYLFITTRNRPSGSLRKAGTGFGLPNLLLRLENSFPDSFLLETSLVDDWFVASLLISMDGRCPDLPPLSTFVSSQTIN